MVGCAPNSHHYNNNNNNIDPLGAGFTGSLLAVPKCRKSVQKRCFEVNVRRQIWDPYVFGLPGFTNPRSKWRNKRVRFDHRTGEPFEKGRMPLKLYDKVMEETREMQKRIRRTFAESPQDKEVRIVYVDESKSMDNNNNKVLIEMEKEPPKFFSKNLLQRSTVHKTDRKSSTSTVKPDNLG